MLALTWLALAGIATLPSATRAVAVASVAVLSKDVRRGAVRNLDISASFETDPETRAPGSQAFWTVAEPCAAELLRQTSHRPCAMSSALGLLTINALSAVSRLIVVTEPSFLALQGILELLDTYDPVREHYNRDLDLAGVIVNRCERTLEHRRSVAEIERCFGDGLAWRPASSEAHRAPGRYAPRPIHRLHSASGREVSDAIAELSHGLAPAHELR